jgi:hypothetical protein
MSWPDAATQRLILTRPRATRKWPDTLITMASWHQVGSSKVLERQNNDRTRQVHYDRMRPNVRSSFSSLHTATSPYVSLIGHTSVVSGHKLLSVWSVPQIEPESATFVYKWPDSSSQHSVTSSAEFRQCFQWKTTPPLHQLLHPCSNVLTTKCITLCTCVSIFSQTFSRVLALH